MNEKTYIKYIFSLLLLLYGITSLAQTVPIGVSYQAVARDNYGKELANKEINVRFSIISGNPQGSLVYQELHSGVITSKYGVFSLVIGKGVPTGGTAGALSEIRWEAASHYLKVEIKFESEYVDMGTMQFLAVPYALYAQRSLEPGPQGPKGETGQQGIQGVQGQKGNPGDPATDDQVLSFDGTNLSISGGNTLNMSTLNVPHQLSVSGNNLSIMGGNTVPLPDQNQDLTLDANNKLKVTNNPAATEVDLTKYLDDKQQLSYNTTSKTLSITNGTAPVDLSGLLNDADADPTNEIQIPSYNPDNFQLSLSKGGGNTTIGQIISFKAGISSTVNLPPSSIVNIVFDQISGVYYTDGVYYNPSTGGFSAPYTGIYSFSISINLPDKSSVILQLNGSTYETMIGQVTASGSYKESIIMKLNKNDIINVGVIQTNTYLIPYSFSGYFSGYRLY